MKLPDFPIAPRRDRSPWPNGETVLHLSGAGLVVESPARQICGDRQPVALFDDDGWKDWPPHESATNDPTS